MFNTCVSIRNDKELKKDETSKDDDITLRRIDSQAFNNNPISHSYTRHIGNFLLTDKEALQKASGNYTMYYYMLHYTIT